VVQKVAGDKSLGRNGFQISAKELQPAGVAKVRSALQSKFGILNDGRDFNSTSVGPTFGKTIANTAVVAIIASLLVISAYVALRFEWKFAVPVLIALMHDLLITAGVYSLTGREVTTSTVAALLTILGYSLYDTIIVFDRVRENVPRMPRAAFSQIVNRSMSEVLTRSLATSFCTLLPIVSLLLFGGQTLKDFAFALMVGVASGAYSSIFIASPVLTHWKEREPVYRNRRTRIVNDLGHVPAYATTAAGEPDDVEPKQRKRRRGNILAPEEPGAQLSRSEFNELVRDLDVEEDAAERSPVPGRAGNGRAGGGGATPTGGASAATRRRAERDAAAKSDPQAPEGNGEPPQTDTGLEVKRDPAADALPEDVVMPDQPRPGPRGSRSKRARRRHGRAR
jgi:SecD/SecF fusion protein